MKRLLYSVLLVAAGAVVYHYVGPELPTNFQLAELSSPGGLLQTVKGKQFELVSLERNLYRLDTFSGQSRRTGGSCQRHGRTPYSNRCR